jgi:hypothetical protein
MDHGNTVEEHYSGTFLKRYAYCINIYKNILNIKTYYHEHINNNRNNHLWYTPCINYRYSNS